MATRVGIRQWAEQRVVSGARVAFDPRGTDKVESTRDPKNYKADEAPHRKAMWQQRQRRNRATEAA